MRRKNGGLGSASVNFITDVSPETKGIALGGDFPDIYDPDNEKNFDFAHENKINFWPSSAETGPMDANYYYQLLPVGDPNAAIYWVYTFLLEFGISFVDLLVLDSAVGFDKTGWQLSDSVMGWGSESDRLVSHDIMELEKEREGEKNERHDLHGRG